MDKNYESYSVTIKVIIYVSLRICPKVRAFFVPTAIRDFKKMVNLSVILFA
jgi:hypothetical protein